MTIHPDFPAHSEAQWRALVEKALRGADYDSLIQHTSDGIVRGPVRTKDDLPDAISAATRHGAPLLEGRPWHITAPIRDPEIKSANNQILTALEGGASALTLKLDSTGETGIAVRTISDLERLLDQVHLDLVPVILETDEDFAALLIASNLCSDSPVYLGLDPLSDSAERALPHLSKSWRAFTIHGDALDRQGASEAQLLGVMASQIIAAMTVHGAQLVHDNLILKLSVSQDGHLEIAKIRALRRLYAQIASSFGIDNAHVPIHAVTSLHMMQSEDAWSNMLRVMSAGFGAVCGGADFITTRPFTDAIGLPTGFGQRIALNMQHLMNEESHLGQVQDVAYGSFYHERLTDDLAKMAWAIMQNVEAEGGYKAAHDSGMIMQMVSAHAETQAARNLPIIGVTLHPAKDGRKPEIRKAPHIAASKAKPIDASTFEGAIAQAKDGRGVSR